MTMKKVHTVVAVVGIAAAAGAAWWFQGLVKKRPSACHGVSAVNSASQSEHHFGSFVKPC